MAPDKTPPKSASASTAFNTAVFRRRSSVPKTPAQEDRRRSLSRSSIYVVENHEPWISNQDMEDLTKLSAHDATKNGDQRFAFKALPTGCKLSKLVGEGAANAVFEFQLPDGSHFRHQDTRLLLRVAKAPVGDDRPMFNYLVQQKYYNTRIRPLLGSHVLHQELVVLRNSNIIDAINDYLRRHDRERKEKFRGSLIGQSDWGFLVEDLRPEDENGLLVEFKPKWLSQSPSAPKNAIRCRQCAKELHNYVMEPDLENPTPTMAKPCPLTLGRDDSNQVRTDSAYRLLPSLEKLGNSEHLYATLTFLRDEPAFKQLRAAQEKNDRVGPLKANANDADFSLAMTLRDCTCFAQITRRASRSRTSIQPLRVRFGDFDMKNPTYRLEYWRRLEEELIDGGFYTAEWLYCGGSYYRPPTQCVLELSNNRRQGVPEITNIHDADPAGSACISNANGCADPKAKTFTIKTNAKKLKQCLEAHHRALTTEEETRLETALNGNHRS